MRPASPRGYRCRVRRELLLWAVAVLCLGGLGFAFFKVFLPFGYSIAWAIILAILLAPVHRWLRRWVPRRGPRALLTCTLAALLLLGPTLTLGTLLVGELVRGIRVVQAAAEAGVLSEIDPMKWGPIVRAREIIDAWGLPYLPNIQADELMNTDRIDFEAAVASAAQQLSQRLLALSGSALSNLANLAFTIVVTWLTLYYLLKDGEWMFQRGIELLPYPDEHKDTMVQRLNEVVFSSVYGGMAVALAQGVLGGIAFAVLGLPSPVLWGTVMAVLAFLPLIGAFVVWAPAALVLLAQGRWIAALVLLLWGGLVVGLVDNFLRPMLISGRTRMHPLLVFLSVLGGIQAFGFLGLFLGPVLVAVVTAVLELYRGAVRGDYGDDFTRRAVIGKG